MAGEASDQYVPPSLAWSHDTTFSTSMRTTTRFAPIAATPAAAASDHSPLYRSYTLRPIACTSSGESRIAAVPTSSTPLSSAYASPVSTRQVMLGSRRRLTIFWLRPYVQNAGRSSAVNPYHMATRCTRPSDPIVATFIVWRPWRNASISSSLIVICARLLIDRLRLVVFRGQLGRGRAVVLVQRGRDVAHAAGPHDVVEQVDGDVLVGRTPRRDRRQPVEQRGPQPRRQDATLAGDDPHGDVVRPRHRGGRQRPG